MNKIPFLKGILFIMLMSIIIQTGYVQKKLHRRKVRLGFIQLRIKINYFFRISSLTLILGYGITQKLM